MQLSQLEKKLNSIYSPHEFSDHCPLGLVIEGKKKVKKGATAVSFTVETVRKAIHMGADFLVVHHVHGLWNNQPKVFTGGLKTKFSGLIKQDISLFVYHLPMDAQPEIGNNALILKELGASYDGGFNREGDKEIGVTGNLPKPLKINEFEKTVKKSIGEINFKFFFGKKTLRKIAVCSGGGAGLVKKAKDSGVDIYLTGEAKEDTLSFCQDERFNFIASGHYRTEVFGPRALADHLSNGIVPTVFIDIPNPV